MKTYWKCAACGWQLETNKLQGPCNYCPHCGGKVWPTIVSWLADKSTPTTAMPD